MDEVFRQSRCKYFLSRTFIDNGCMIWKGIKNSGGYGLARVSGTHIIVPRFIAFSMLLDNDEDRIKFQHRLACHTCDNPSCINPSHLYLGTRSQNQRDWVERKVERAIGENHGNHKLSNADVLEIRRLFDNKEFISIARLAKKFRVSVGTVSQIVNRVTWTHI